MRGYNGDDDGCVPQLFSPSPPQHCGETILGSGWEKWYGDGEVITALAMSHLCLYCLFAF